MPLLSIVTGQESVCMCFCLLDGWMDGDRTEKVNVCTSFNSESVLSCSFEGTKCRRKAVESGSKS